MDGYQGESGGSSESDRAGEIVVAVVSDRVAVVVFVGDRDEPFWSDSIFKKEGSPVAAFLVISLMACLNLMVFPYVVPHVLELKADAVLVVDFLDYLTEGDIGFHHFCAWVVLNSLHVVEEVDIHEGEAESPVYFLLNL